jgi:gluconokinase
MSRGIPLTDNDREWWLKTLNYQFISSNSIVVACSALKHEYRCLLKENNQNLIVVYLKGSFATILDRHQKRKNHFFNGKSMLKSQFDTLVEPAEGEAIFIDIDQSVETVVVQALKEIDKLHWQACKLQDVRW